MARFLTLPHEVLHHVLVEVDTQDLYSLQRSCRSLDNFIQNNVLLFKEQYLRSYDNPLPQQAEPDSWPIKAQKLAKLNRLLRLKDEAVMERDLVDICSAVAHLLATAAPEENISERISRNHVWLREAFDDDSVRKTLLRKSNLCQRAAETSSLSGTLESRQASAKLHCLYGQTFTKEDVDALQPYACSKVYDMRQYTQKSLWGPFKDDGSQSVDWEKLEAIMIDLNYNIREFSERSGNLFVAPWMRPFQGATPFTYRHRSEPGPPVLILQPSLPPDLQDPYNVTGMWTRIVCFLDYSELWTYNFTQEGTMIEKDREPLDRIEAFRLINMKLTATGVTAPSEDQGQSRPVVHFKGKSYARRAIWDPNANSDIRGWVAMTPEGEVRWTTLSVYGGEERWRSEGVQIGGIQSARGVWGNWFDKDYDYHGPAGPTVFWKVSDVLEEEDEATGLSRFLPLCLRYDGEDRAYYREVMHGF